MGKKQAYHFFYAGRVCGYKGVGPNYSEIMNIMINIKNKLVQELQWTTENVFLFTMRSKFKSSTAQGTEMLVSACSNQLAAISCVM